MNKKFNAIHTKGFTLVELLIVVIIVAILAAIVVPQFNGSTKEAKEATLDSNLQAIRAAMELYKVQHNGTYPGDKPTNGGACTETNGKGTAAAAGSQAFIEQLTKASDIDGNTCGLADATYKYGPYLKPTLPKEPISGKGAIASEIATTTTGVPITAGSAGGWAVDTKSGQFIANNTALHSNGSAYSTR